MTDTDGNTLFFIKKQFMYCVPLKQFNWKNLFENVSIDVQEVLTNNTVNNSILIKYPIKASYQTAFLKFIINNLEKKKTEIHDCVYEALGRTMALPVPSAYHFKHFIFQNLDPIIIQESTNIISSGTTGLSVWEASVVLSEWCIANRERLKGKSILELGSGLGLTGITISRFCNPKIIRFSDCHQQVFDILSRNIKLNLENTLSTSDMSKSESPVIQKFVSDNQIVEVLKLFWEEIDENFCKSKEIDYVLAADVVYDSSIFPVLINALKLLIYYCNVTVIFACTQRNPETLESFLKTVVDNSLSLTKLNVPEQKEFIWPNDVPVKIFCIHRDEVKDFNIGVSQVE
ncbi:protein-lysine N-methyltransferase EEF2KMT [Agrilus planipennis]|uniref:Protein-lysine N-methyltransferase EEF2KMT n=1 Tax=Agrilus planipennis TaxID=224129 RepID=A0A1W4XIQ1_AGRPL|nr:protein-lysine N-methyltransferase EEF2KMT [Agrilus planipennis]